MWCDTPYASWNPEGEEISVAEIVRQVEVFGAKHVVLTGGEPVIMPEIGELCAELKLRGHHITVETAATVYKDLRIDLASLSPKLSNSTPHDREGGRFARVHEEHRLNVPVIQRFIDIAPEFQLKFVVSRAEDLAEIHARTGTVARLATFRCVADAGGGGCEIAGRTRRISWGDLQADRVSLLSAVACSDVWK